MIDRLQWPTHEGTKRRPKVTDFIGSVRCGKINFSFFELSPIGDRQDALCLIASNLKPRVNDAGVPFSISWRLRLPTLFGCQTNSYYYHAGIAPV
jgi:hypothetical protein